MITQPIAYSLTISTDFRVKEDFVCLCRRNLTVIVHIFPWQGSLSAEITVNDLHLITLCRV